jgi:hypothetical protein
MSTIKVDTITDEAGSGAPDFPNGLTGNGSSLTGLATAAQGALAATALQSSSSLTAANLTGALPAIDGSALTGVGASTTAGAVGTYALLRNQTSSAKWAGDTLAGSSTLYSAASANNSGSPSGTWRCMGFAMAGTGSPADVTVFVRIS